MAEDDVVMNKIPVVSYPLRKVLGIAGALALVVVVGIAAFRSRVPEDRLHRAITGADTIVVRHGRESAGEPLINAATLFTVEEVSAVTDVFHNLAFVSKQEGESDIAAVCSCESRLHIGWYRRGELVADTAVMHGNAIRWDGWGQRELTPAAERWLLRWFELHGVPASFVQEPPE